MKVQKSLKELYTIDYYNMNAADYFSRSVHLEMHTLYEKFLMFVPEGGKILDAGCGSGRDTKYFLSLGYEVTAIDASEEMVKLSTQFTKQESTLMNFYDLDFQEIFDGIWSIASLLHLPRNRIEDVMQRFTSALKSDGIWCMSFKEGNCERVDENGRFFNDYDVRTFRSLLEKHPLLQIEDIWLREDCMGRNQRWMTALLSKR